MFLNAVLILSLLSIEGLNVNQYTNIRYSEPENVTVDSLENDTTKKYYYTLHLNAPLQPLHRYYIYEIPLNEALQQNGYGEIDGGGTLLGQNNEIISCDIDFYLNENSKECKNELLEILHKIGLPKGSVLRSEETEEPLGRLEGLALYINDVDLPAEVYASCDINFVIDEISKLLGDTGHLYSYREDEKYTILYFYGDSFEQMKSFVESVTANYPLCEKSYIKKMTGK